MKIEITGNDWNFRKRQFDKLYDTIDFILTEKSVRLHLPFPEVMIQSIPSSQLTSKEILELFSTIFQYE